MKIDPSVQNIGADATVCEIAMLFCYHIFQPSPVVTISMFSLPFHHARHGHSEIAAHLLGHMAAPGGHQQLGPGHGQELRWSLQGGLGAKSGLGRGGLAEVGAWLRWGSFEKARIKNKVVRRRLTKRTSECAHPKMDLYL